MGRESKACHLGIRDLHTGRIASIIDGTLHVQAGAGVVAPIDCTIVW
jgi:hypothetical protein